MSFSLALQKHIEVFEKLHHQLGEIETIANVLLNILKKNGKILLIGNGGSAADAQHIAAELIGRFKLERAAIPAIALTTDTSILTCLSNDYDYAYVFARQLEALCRPEDAIIALSTSGNSTNILNGVQTAKKIGAVCVALTGESGGKLAEHADFCIKIASNDTARIQEAHIFVGHIICEYIEQTLSAR
ncbi:MAG: SIS domain-containing protein [Gammaproteobacteria bacterium]|nr:MAG: SIS domain-containing protein [Gammaproteobacteria bacterium]